MAYELSYPEWRKFFDPASLEEVFSRTNESIWIHYWNYMARGTDMLIQPDLPLYKVMQKHCPKTEEIELRRLIGRENW